MSEKMSRRDFLTLAAATAVGAGSGVAAFESSRKKKAVESEELTPLVAEEPASQEPVLSGKEIKETKKRFAIGAFLDEEIDRLTQTLSESEKESLLSDLARFGKKEKEKIYEKRFSNRQEQMAKYFEPFLNSQEDIRDALDEADPLNLIPRAVLCGLIGMESGGKQSTNRETGAAGMFQLNLITAKEMGLKVDKKVDERMDLKKSAGAAARYLLDLYERFGRQWGLALAAYAGGPGKLTERIREHFKLNSQTSFTPDLFSEKNINVVTLYRGFGVRHSVQYPFGAQAMAGWLGKFLKTEEEYEEGESALA